LNFPDALMVANDCTAGRLRQVYEERLVRLNQCVAFDVDAD
jgi:hypothetical protein